MTEDEQMTHEREDEHPGSMLASWLVLVIMALVVVAGVLLLAMRAAG